MQSKFFEECKKLMGDEKELHVFRGLLLNPVRCTKEDGTFYFKIDLKCLKTYGDDQEYGQTYNMYHMIVPAEQAADITQQELTNYKNNEVFVIATLRGQVRQKDSYKYNNTSFFVADIGLSREVGNRIQAVRNVEAI